MTGLLRRLIQLVSAVAWAVIGAYALTWYMNGFSTATPEATWSFITYIALGFILGGAFGLSLLFFVKSLPGAIASAAVAALLIGGNRAWVAYRADRSGIVYVLPKEMIRHHGYYKGYALTLAPHEGYEKCLYDGDEARRLIDQDEDPDDIRTWLIYVPTGDCDSTAPARGVDRDSRSIRIWGRRHELNRTRTGEEWLALERRVKYEFRSVDTARLYAATRADLQDMRSSLPDGAVHAYRSGPGAWAFISLKSHPTDPERTVVLFRNLRFINRRWVHLDFVEHLTGSTTLGALRRRNDAILRADVDYGKLF